MNQQLQRVLKAVRVAARPSPEGGRRGFAGHPLDQQSPDVRLSPRRIAKIERECRQPWFVSRPMRRSAKWFARMTHKGGPHGVGALAMKLRWNADTLRALELIYAFRFQNVIRQPREASCSGLR